ncbi:MAG: ParB/RepB/Spo0J family partition protein [Elusimicrobia bacterium]|nr:ParB/RepB/Spo0J family partition protein [Elusimicrobiota bacterium]
MKRVLGKGLESLIPEKTDNEIKEIDTDKLITNKYQMRTDFNESKIAEMAESIKKNGLVQPIIVKRTGNRYMIVAGERRWRSAKKAGLKSVPCIEKDISDEELLIVSLIENVQREDLSVVEEAAAYDRMIRDFSMTQQEISEKVGKSRSTVANVLRILTLDKDIIKLIDADRITAGHARALLSVSDAQKRKKLAERIINEKLTVREAERLAGLFSGKMKNAARKAKKARPSDPELEKFKGMFEKRLGTKVNIVLKGGGRSASRKDLKGSIEIEFYSMDDFERISEIICKK